MSYRPRRTKPDKNQKQIVDDLRKLGFDVDVICNLPGLFDIIVSGRRYFRLQYGNNTEDIYTDNITCSVRVEIKSEKGELNATEKDYFEAQKHRGSYIVARCVEDVLDWFGMT